MSGRGLSGGRGLVLVRVAFWVYAVVLVVLTHWPRLQAPNLGVERSDLVIHVGAFAGLAALLQWTGYCGVVGRVRTAVVAGVAGVVWGVLDEGTQAIPWFGRTFAWEDMGADVMGAVVGTVMGAVVGRWVCGVGTRRGDR